MRFGLADLTSSTQAGKEYAVVSHGHDMHRSYTPNKKSLSDSADHGICHDAIEYFPVLVDPIQTSTHNSSDCYRQANPVFALVLPSFLSSTEGLDVSSSLDTQRECSDGSRCSLSLGDAVLLEADLVGDLAFLLLGDAVALFFLGSLLGLDPAGSGLVGAVDVHCCGV